jgi:hypothetical protein
MVRRDDVDVQQQQQWHRRAEQGRKKLSASVEDVLADRSIPEEPEEELADAEESDDRDAAGVVIPPRLSLQSREMAIVPPQGSGRETSAGEESEQDRQGANRVLLEFARRVTSSLAALGMTRQPVARPPRSPVTAVLPAQPIRGPAEASAVSAGSMEAVRVSESGAASVAAPGPRASEAAGLQAMAQAGRAAVAQQVGLGEPPSSPARTQQRLAGRTTRVRLEAAPRPAASTPAARSAFYESAFRPQPSSQPDESRAVRTSLPAELEQRGWQSGQGTFARGQGEAAVSHPSINDASVVLVTLTGDPGPVVVHYVSLQPGKGFTVHLSAPTQREAPFRYVVLGG